MNLAPATSSFVHRSPAGTHRARRIVATVALLASLPLPAFAAPAEPTLAEVLPSETFLYASFDARALDRGIRDLDLAALLREAEVSAFLSPLLKSMPDVDEKDPVGSLLAQSPLSAWLEGEVAFGVAGVEIAIGGPDAEVIRVSPRHPLSARLFHQVASVMHEPDHGSAGPERWFFVDGILSVTPGPALREHVKEFLAAPPEHCEVTSSRIDGRDATVLTVRLPGGVNTRVWCDLSGSRWWISGSQRTFEAALRGERQSTLAATPMYRNCHERVASGPTAAFVMIDFKQACGLFESCVPPIVLEELRILGLDSVRGFAFGTSFVEGGVRESALLAFDGEPRGLLAPFKALGGGFPTLDAAPANTAFFAGVRFDAERLLAELRSAAKSLAPNATRTLAGELEGARVGPLGLVEDLVPAFGSEMSLALGVPRTGMIPDAVFVLELRDVERFRKLLDVARSQSASEGVQIRPLPLADGREGFSVTLPGAPVQPAFVIDGKRLIGAVSGPGLKAYLAKQRSGSETLASDAGLQSLRRAFGGAKAESATLWLHLDLQKSLPTVYEAATPFIPGLIQETGAPLDAAQLPLAETVAQHLKSIALAVHCDAGGISIDMFSPTGLIGAGLVAAIAESHHHSPAPAPVRRGAKDPEEVW